MLGAGRRQYIVPILEWDLRSPLPCTPGYNRVFSYEQKRAGEGVVIVRLTRLPSNAEEEEALKWAIVYARHRGVRFILPDFGVWRAYRPAVRANTGRISDWV